MKMPSLAQIALTTLILSFDLTGADYCSTIHAEFTRRQLSEHNVNAPYDESGGAKHVPFITLDGGTATVTVGDGNPYHPMSASSDSRNVHFISHIYVMDQEENIVHLDVLDPVQGSPAVTNFEIPAGVTSLTAYEWCNLHGLWMGPTVEVVANSNSISTCGLVHPSEPAWPSVHADLMRVQSEPPFLETSPYTEENGSKHTPYITVHENGKTGRVVVGTEEAYHPMSFESPHWVTIIYVTDQNDDIIAMKNLNPNAVSKAEMTFKIPEYVKEVTAWEFCNLHGLWKGPTVSINDEEDSSSFTTRTSFPIFLVITGIFAHL